MNIYIKELKSHRKSLVFWSLGMIFMIAAGMSKFTAASGSSMNELMADMPKSLQAVMGVGAFDLAKASGYYGMLFFYLLLMAAVHAAMLGATIIAKEERDKTFEFLFVKPVTRGKIITVKLAAALTNVVILNLITFLTSAVIVGRYSEGEAVLGEISMTMAAMFILQVLFMVLGSAIAAVKKRPKKASSVAAAILLLLFVLSVAIDLTEQLNMLRYFTPFKYFEAKSIMYGGGFDTLYVCLAIILIGSLTAATYLVYRKRDLQG